MRSPFIACIAASILFSARLVAAPATAANAKVCRTEFWSHSLPNKRCTDSGVLMASFPNS